MDSHPVMVEQIGESHGSIRSVTLVAKNGVYYAVERRVGTEYVTEWETAVFFARDKAHRPSGVAFAQGGTRAGAENVRCPQESGRASGLQQRGAGIIRR